MKRFRPLFWGFVFNARDKWGEWTLDIGDVFVPSSGDLFLMSKTRPMRCTI